MAVPIRAASCGIACVSTSVRRWSTAGTGSGTGRWIPSWAPGIIRPWSRSRNAPLGSHACNTSPRERPTPSPTPSKSNWPHFGIQSGRSRLIMAKSSRTMEPSPPLCSVGTRHKRKYEWADPTIPAERQCIDWSPDRRDPTHHGSVE